MRLASLCVLAVLFAAPARAQYPAPADSVAGPVLPPAPVEEANHAPHPNRVPYTSGEHLGHHVLAAPATVWGGVTGVFREGVLWAEYSGLLDRVRRRLLAPEPPPFGVSPELSVGGQEGVVAGGSVYYNDLFGTGRHVRVGARYGLSGTYSVTGRFRDPSLFGSGVPFGLGGGYYRDTEEAIYFGGNDGAEDDRLRYRYEQGLAHATAAVPLPHHLRFVIEGEFKHIIVRDGDGDFLDGNLLEEVDGFGEANLLSGGASLVLDLSETGGLHAPRRYQGTVFLLGYQYGQDVGGRNFAYHRAAAEVRQFLPLPFLPFDRRLAVRARLEKTHPPAGFYVPFYEASALGGAYSLRGYPTYRFRDEGTLLVNAEYRWPVWDTLDGVLFFDAGQAFHRYRDLRLADFHHNVGLGLHVYGRAGVAGRVEFAYGPEGPRLIAQIGTLF